MSFRCEHCGFSNNEVQSAGAIRCKQSPTRQDSYLSLRYPFQRRELSTLLVYFRGKI